MKYIECYPVEILGLQAKHRPEIENNQEIVKISLKTIQT